MSYRAFLLFSVYGIALAGWGALAVSGRMAAPWLGAALAAYAVGVVGDMSGRHPLRAAWNRALLALGIGLALADWRWLSGSWFLAVVALMLYVSMVRALSPKANRDLEQMIGLAFLQLLAASVLTLDLGYAVFFILFFVLAPWALLAVAVKAELEGEFDLLRGRVAVEGTLVAPAGAERMLSRGTLAAMNLSLALTMSITALFFLLFPRLSTGLISGRLGLDTPMSGLSEQVRLGDMGAILTDSSPAARVEILSGPPIEVEQLYLRAIALDHFDGRTWRETAGTSRVADWRGRFDLVEANRIAPTHRIKVLLEDLGTDLLPTVPQALRLESPRSLISQSVFGVIRQPGAKGGLRYELDVALVDSRAWQRIDWAALPAHPALPATMQELVALPDIELPGPIVAWAERPDLSWVPRALADFARYKYTLDLPDPQRPLAAFFERRAGHCELFATSLALMLRASGVPAWVVNGFRGGEVIGDYILVRQRNAHSWVEFAHPLLGGTVMLDPTLAAPPQGGGWSQVGETVQRLVDRLRFIWMDRIVSYDLDIQKQAFDASRDAVGRWRDRWSALRARLGRMGVALLWVVGGAMATLVAALLLRLRSPAAVASGPRRAVPRWARQLLSAAEQASGRRRSVADPLARWAANLDLPAPIHGQLISWVRDYESWRFGPSGGQERTLRSRAFHLRRALRRTRARRES